MSRAIEPVGMSFMATSGEAPRRRRAPDPHGVAGGIRAGRDALHGDLGRVTQAHDGALAELLVDLGEGHVEGLVAVERCHGAHLREVASRVSWGRCGVGGDARPGVRRFPVTDSACGGTTCLWTPL